jgi:hypothetical protein
MNVETDLKIEETFFPLTGQVEYRIKMRKLSKRFNLKKFKLELIEKWVEHPLVYDEYEWPIWTDACIYFKTFDSAKASMDILVNYYLNKTTIKTII